MYFVIIAFIVGIQMFWHTLVYIHFTPYKNTLVITETPRQ